MVLDIRYLWAGGEAAPPPSNQAAPPHAIEVAAGPEPAGPAPPTDLGELLGRAAEAAKDEERAGAVAQLRSLEPSPEGVAVLASILDSPADPRRLVAAQVLGHHRQWLSQKSGVERLVEWAVRGMLPKTRLGDRLFTKLKVYAGPDHPHEAQCPRPLNVAE